MKRQMTTALAMLAALIAAWPATAHMPEKIALDQTVEKPKISWALYGRFDKGDEVYTIRLSYDSGFALPFELLVPHHDDLERFRPAYAVVGPGLPAPTDDERTFLPRDVPAGAGVFIARNDAPERLVIFESIMRRVFWSTGPVALALRAGDYEVWVFNPDGTTGDFTLGLGVEEDFSGGGWKKVFEDWSTFAY